MCKYVLHIVEYRNRRHIDYCYAPVYPLDGTVMVVKEVEIESTSVHFKHFYWYFTVHIVLFNVT